MFLLEKLSIRRLTCCNTYLIPNALNFALVWFFEYITALG